MNKLAHFFLLMYLFCLPANIMAQKDEDDDESKYLVGAVPLVDGKVVFSKEFIIPGMSEDQIFDRMLKWMNLRLKKNQNDSRVVYSDKAKGTIAGIGEEWIVFSSSALSLDRTLIDYQITAICKPGKCLMEIEKIRYTYREKEKYLAEEWITDKWALNKSQTKLVRGLAKWRKKTVDFANTLFADADRALKISADSTPKTEKDIQEVSKVAISPSTNNAPVVPDSNMAGYKEIVPDQIPADIIRMGAGKLVIAIGKDAFNMTMMTANAGGSLGKVSGKPVVFCILSPDQSYDQIEKADVYSVRFYPENQQEPSIILECKKIPAQAPLEGQPRTYIGEIIKAWIK